jgi:hypothetical protein
VGEVGRDVQLLDDRPNLLEGSDVGAPKRCRLPPSEPFDKLVRTRIGDGGQVRGCMSAIPGRQPLALEKRHAEAGLREQESGGQAGDAATDHENIDHEVTVERGLRGEGLAPPKTWESRPRRPSPSQVQTKFPGPLPGRGRTGCGGVPLVCT